MSGEVAQKMWGTEIWTSLKPEITHEKSLAPRVAISKRGRGFELGGTGGTRGTRFQVGHPNCSATLPPLKDISI